MKERQETRRESGEREADSRKTRLISVSPESLNADAIAIAVDVLRNGGLVAFPTETVYGLGANALDAEAVAQIFVAKGRPSTNPLIVHAADTDAARALVSEWPETAQILAERFWPGPLTLVLPKAANIPDIVTGSGPTVGIRVPAHPVALALLRAAGVPVAAPSANRSEALSPVRAEHVLAGLDGRIDVILNGGPTTDRKMEGQVLPTGLESTVVSLTGTPRLLRPGLIAPSDIEAVIGPIARPEKSVEKTAVLPSPGMMTRHYAPRAHLELLKTFPLWDRAETLLRMSQGVVVIHYSESVPVWLGTYLRHLKTRKLPAQPVAYGSALYDTLHEVDTQEVDFILVERPPAGDEWLAIRDRLTRAAARPDS